MEASPAASKCRPVHAVDAIAGRAPRRLGARVLAAWAIVVFGGVATTGPAAALELAVLPAFVNGVATGDMTVFFEEADALVRSADLAGAGIRVLAGRTRVERGETFVSLASLAPGVRWQFDDSELRIDLTVDPDLLPNVHREIRNGRPSGLVYSADPAAFVNYSATVEDGGALSGFSEIGWSRGRTLLYGSVAVQAGGEMVRGLTSLTVDDREKMIRWVAGDSFAAGGSLGGSALLAGLSVSRNFSLDPYFYRYPGVGVSGAVMTPSRADIYVNGRLVAQETLAPGTFDFSNLPVEHGSGETRVVLRDAFGGERVLTSSYYLSTGLLAKGLHDFSYSLGLRRENAADESFRYGDPVFVASHRVGLSDRLTLGLRMEASTDVASGGGSMVTTFAHGEIDASLAASTGSGWHGSAGSLRGSTRLGRFSLGAYGQGMSAHYANVSLPADQDRAVSSGGVFAGAALGRAGSVTLEFAQQDWRDGGTSRRLSAAYSTRLYDGVSLLVNLSRVRTPVGGDATEIWATLNFALARHHTANARWRRDDEGTSYSAGVRRSPPLAEGFGYSLDATAQDGGAADGTAIAEYRGRRGIVAGTYRKSAGGSSGHLTGAGGLAVLGGSVFASRPIEQGFALLRVPGVTGVEGYSRNQPAGRTNRRGELLVPDLLPYYANRLAIADTDLPADYIVDSVERVIAPPFRGGAVVTFPVRRLRAYSGTVIVSFHGIEVAPLYGELSLSADGKEYSSDIGSSGNFYLEDVPPGVRRARVSYLGRTCDFDLLLPASQEPVARLGALVCRTEEIAPDRGREAAPHPGAQSDSLQEKP
jgi:outer membrane usher protein